MPMHDWTRVKPGIFHDFDHEWISQIKRTLNEGLLPSDYYALAEQVAAGFGPDILTLQTGEPDPQTDGTKGGNGAPRAVVLQRPKARFTAQSDAEFYRRKKSAVVIRHVSDDRIVAIVEIVSPGNKASRNAFKAFIDKACELLEHRIHLLIVDPFPPTKRDPDGIHAAIWQEIVEDSEFELPPDKRLTLASYESALVVKAYVETIAVGDALPALPLVLEPDGAVEAPLEATYQAAFALVPRRWQRVLE